MSASASTPAIILVGPQLGENIGMAARAMANFGLSDLRLVNPRDGWPNIDAVKAASGADWVINNAKLFASAADAIADLHFVAATTARSRELMKPVLTAEAAADAMRETVARGLNCGVLFGPERAGLDNDAVALAQVVLRIPADPRFSSLNLAQAVLLTGYEWFRTTPDQAPKVLDIGENRPASNGELQGLFEHVERELDRAGFFYPPEKRPAMVRNLRTIFQRQSLLEQDVRTLRGVIRALAAMRGEKEKG
ncbi:MAG: RNA methyltransferase [Pseudomonadota bacterium]